MERVEGSRFVMARETGKEDTLQCGKYILDVVRKCRRTDDTMTCHVTSDNPDKAWSGSLWGTRVALPTNEGVGTLWPRKRLSTPL